MTRDEFVTHVSDLRDAVRVMADNLAFIEMELPGLEVAPGLRDDILAVCRDFRSSLYDIRGEIFVLEDKLALPPEDQSYDPGVSSRDPQATMDLIERWLSNEIHSMHALVTRVQSHAQAVADLATVGVLVTESAANILNAYAGAREALRSISQNIQR